MSKKNLRTAFIKLAAPALFAFALVVPAAVGAQEMKPNQQQPETPATTQTTVVTQTPTAEKTAAAKPAEAQPAGATTPAAAEPLFKEYKGVRVGLSADEVRAKLGKPEEKSDAMDFFVFSDRERARVYYDKDKKAHAVIVTYIGRNGGAPLPAAVIGTEIEAKADGSMYQMVTYPQAGYWVAYSRTAGDSPMVMITMQKTP